MGELEIKQNELRKEQEKGQALIDDLE